MNNQIPGNNIGAVNLGPLTPNGTNMGNTLSEIDAPSPIRNSLDILDQRLGELEVSARILVKRLEPVTIMENLPKKEVGPQPSKSELHMTIDSAVERIADLNELLHSLQRGLQL